jgi:hypothetical protein
MSIYLVAWFLSVEKGRRAVISAPGSRCELQKVQAASRSLPSRYTTSRLPPWGVYNESTAGPPALTTLNVYQSIIGKPRPTILNTIVADPVLVLPLDPGSVSGIRDG